MGPALLPPAWSGVVSLALAGALALVLGGLVRRTAGHWGTVLLWVGWVLVAVQWGWAWGSQPSGLPYWLAGLLLGVLGAALVRPGTPVAPEAEEIESQHPDPLPAAPADSWTAPLDTPAQDQAVQSQLSQAQLTRSQPAPEWTVPIAPAAVQATAQPGRPVWAEEEPSSPAVPAADSWSVPLAGTAAAPAPAQRTPAPADWQGQTWWAPDDEPADPPGVAAPLSADWAEAEALLERGQGEGAAPPATPRRTLRLPDPKEEIEDRE
ncbi:hypothetical protein Deipr_0599 [Deinococcus proteolyticus MRP]|uniref:Uncharacterized protein n=1 Tax=Deinococcus proteolyticus (strain ATCC 35074 / DSM 20540 / JCM 6276 / NBRC 101906 / NCIMB 13154 / VKM Ac-1939 / CCM 2703 / MRP) TaxID=693977 RepID=F0RKY8_DEIPM|nr:MULTISPECIES: hypothetical protein [Deinococcus]ADY25761.1 hypothetical protein Deipr_0599 [Deinococcus proteolyticus MRP]MCY1701885.1 hypothetical protein [Deinococcus sp. SL84]